MSKSRNRTLTLTDNEQSRFLARCITLAQPAEITELTNKTINGDTLQTIDYFPKGFVDLLILDPPYNISKNFNGMSFRKMDYDSYVNYLEEWFVRLLPLMKPSGTIYFCCDWQSSMAVGQVLRKFCMIHNRITWQREKGRGSLTNWKNSMEDIWFASCGKSYGFHAERVKLRRRVIAPYKKDGVPKDWEETDKGRFRNTFPSNFWDDITVPYWSMSENTPHPTQKPEKLLARLILASSDENDMVMDPFLGSGTTSVVAKKLGRRYVGIEMDPMYCAFAEKRLELAECDKTIQGYRDGVFWERNSLVKG